jgi:hypothetical protein
MAWYNESLRHSKAALGVKTGRKDRSKGKFAFKSRAALHASRPVSIDEHNWGFEIDEDGKWKLRLGNWSDAGWNWDGDDKDVVSYLIRLKNSDVKSDFLEAMDEKGITFDAFKEKMMKSIDEDDGIYEITGDNKRWKFGEAFEPDTGSEIDYLVDEEGYTEEEARRIVDGAFTFTGTTWSDFVNTDKYRSAKRELTEAIEQSNSFEQFFKEIDDRQEGIQEDMFEFDNNNWMESIGKSREKFDDDFYTGIEGVAWKFRYGRKEYKFVTDKDALKDYEKDPAWSIDKNPSKELVQEIRRNPSPAVKSVGKQKELN